VSIGDEDAESDQQATADGDSTGKSKPKMAMQGLLVFLSHVCHALDCLFPVDWFGISRVKRGRETTALILLDVSI